MHVWLASEAAAENARIDWLDSRKAILGLSDELSYEFLQRIQPWRGYR